MRPHHRERALRRPAGRGHRVAAGIMTDAFLDDGATLSRRISALPATYALKVSLVAVLSLYIAFLFDLDHTFWAILTVPLIVRPDGGNTVWRSMARLTGTMLGCLSGFALAVTFGQEAETIIPATAIYIFLASYLARLQSGLDGYAYASAGLVALTITLDSGPDIQTAFDLAVTRATETAIPVVAALVVMFALFPRSVAQDARTALLAARAATLSAAAAVLAGKEDENDYERTVLPALTQLNMALRALAHERTRRHRVRRRIAAVGAALNRVALQAEVIRVALAGSPPTRLTPAVVATRARLAERLADLPAPDADAAARDTAAAQLRETAEAPTPALGPVEAAPFDEEGLARCALLSRLADLARGLAELMAAEAALIDTTRPGPSARLATRRYADHIAALEGASRPTVIFLALSALWLATAWPDGLTLTLIASAISLVLPTIVPRAARVPGAINIAIGIAMGGVVALALMTVLPRLETFAGFAIVFGATVFAIFINAQRLQDLPFAIGTMLAISVGFQPQNQQVYDPEALFNTVLTLLLLPVAFIAGQTIVFPENLAWVKRHLARASDRLLARAARGRTEPAVLAEEFFDVLGEFDLSFAPPDREGAHLSRRTRAALLAGDALLEVAEIERAGRLPAPLQGAGATLRETAAAAASGRPLPTEALAAIQATLGAALAEVEGDTRRAVLRLCAASELIVSIAAAGWLTRRVPDAS